MNELCKKKLNFNTNKPLITLERVLYIFGNLLWSHGIPSLSIYVNICLKGHDLYYQTTVLCAPQVFPIWTFCGTFIFHRSAFVVIHEIVLILLYIRPGTL